MAVFRIEKTRDYTVMSNHHLRNTNLSLKAKGLLSLMLSLPEEWDYTTKGLARICKDGVDSICAGVRELEEQGYVIRERVRNPNGQLGSIEYTILEQPRPPEREKPERENPVLDNPILGSPVLEEPEQGIINQELLCRGWFLPPNTYDCGSFVVNGTAVVGKELKHSITAGNQHTKELTFMKSLFEQMGGTYRQVGDYLIPNLSLPEKSDYQIGKYGRLRRNYLKEYHPVLYANFLTSGTLHRHLAEIDQACNERMEIIISDMAKQDGVTETLKVADQMEWVRRMNSIRSRAEEIVLTELVYE